MLKHLMPWPKLLLILAALGLVVGLAIPFHKDGKNEFDDVYRKAAGLVRDGEDVYRTEPLYTYPPFMAWALIPFSHLPTQVARVLWYAVNIGCLFAMVWLAWQIAFWNCGLRIADCGLKDQSKADADADVTASPSPQSAIRNPKSEIEPPTTQSLNSTATTPSAPQSAIRNPQSAIEPAMTQPPHEDPWLNRARWAVFGFGLFLGLRAGTNSVLHHQTDLTLGTFLFLGLFLVQRCLPYLGSICIGLAGAMKCTPLLFAIYFLWRRPRLAAATLVAVALGVNFLPHVTHPPKNGELLAETWFHSTVVRLMKPHKYPGSWNVDVTTNQSLAGSVNAWMRTRWSVENGNFTIHKQEATLPPLAAKAFVYGFGLLVLGITLHLMRRMPVEDRFGQAATFGAFLLIMLLMSPMSHKTHFTLMLLPAFVVGRQWLERPSRRLAIFIGALLLVQLLSLRAFSVTLAAIATWHGSQMISTLLLLACTWFVMEERLTPAQAEMKPSEQDEAKPPPAPAAAAPAPLPAMPSVEAAKAVEKPVAKAA